MNMSKPQMSCWFSIVLQL